MEKSPAFGRAPDRVPGRPPIPPKRHLQAPVAACVPLQDPVAEELRAWRAGRQQRQFPWRPFLLMAGLCFGIGSLILPDTVNDAVSWILYALTGISFFAGLRRRRTL